MKNITKMNECSDENYICVGHLYGELLYLRVIGNSLDERELRVQHVKEYLQFSNKIWLNRNSKKPSILQQIKDFIGQIGCDQL